MNKSNQPEVDWLIFGLSATLLALVVLPVVLFPEASQSAINAIFKVLTTQFGVLYVTLTTAIIVLLLYIAISPWGNIRLGRIEARYSQFSWISMLFCCGIGGSVIYWGATEWVYYYTSPPFGALAKVMPQPSGPRPTACSTGAPAAGHCIVCQPLRSVALIT